MGENDKYVPCKGETPEANGETNGAKHDDWGQGDEYQEYGEGDYYDDGYNNSYDDYSSSSRKRPDMDFNFLGDIMKKAKEANKNVVSDGSGCGPKTVKPWAETMGKGETVKADVNGEGGRKMNSGRKQLLKDYDGDGKSDSRY